MIQIVASVLFVAFVLAIAVALAFVISYGAILASSLFVPWRFRRAKRIATNQARKYLEEQLRVQYGWTDQQILSATQTVRRRDQCSYNEALRELFPAAYRVSSRIAS
jgi:hypothetical protein